MCITKQRCVLIPFDGYCDLQGITTSRLNFRWWLVDNDSMPEDIVCIEKWDSLYKKFRESTKGVFN